MTILMQMREAAILSKLRRLIGSMAAIFTQNYRFINL